MQLHPKFSLRLIGCMGMVLMTACGGGSGQSSSTVAAIPPPIASPPPPVDLGNKPAADGSISAQAPKLNFRVNEDESLAERLTNPNDETVQFALFRNAIYGQATVDADGQFSYSPNADFNGTDVFEYYLWSADGGSLPAQVLVTVLPVGDPPEITGDPATIARQGERYSAQFFAVDADLEELAFVSSTLPLWLTLDSVTGELTGLPAQEDVGLHSISISVVDSGGVFTAFETFIIEVINVNDAPEINLGQFPVALDAREELTIDLAPFDADGDLVEIGVMSNDYIDAEVDGKELRLKVANVKEVIETDFVITATDRHGAELERVISVTLHPLNSSGQARTYHGRQEGAGVHIVILGDGYQPTEFGLFRDHVDSVIDLMREDPAIATHMSAIHVHAINTPSLDSGIDDQFNDDIRNTVFGAGYNCHGIERLICANELAMFNAALEEYPFLNQLILLVNDQRFGGSGGSVAVASAYYPEITLHEMGHSIARLADEYVVSDFESQSAPSFVEGQFPNVSSETDPYAVPWSHWIENKSNYPTQEGQVGVGIFAGAYYTNDLYRGTTDSRMRSNDRLFGPVGGEQWVLSLYRSIGAVLEFGPVLRQVEVEAGEKSKFYVAPLFDDSLQTVEWFLDGELLTHTSRETEISLALNSGAHRLDVKVSDISGLVRSDKINPSVFNWYWEINVQ